MDNFLPFLSAWWVISDSNVKLDASPRGTVVTATNSKGEFSLKLASYVDEYRQSPKFVSTNRHPMVK